jgi:chromosome segregation ATPase
MDKKTITIIVLAVLLSLCFLWGAWGNQYYKVYRADLYTADKEIAELKSTLEQSEAVGTKATRLAEDIKSQLVKTRKELASLDQVKQTLELKLTELADSKKKQLAGKDVTLAEFIKNSDDYIFNLGKQLTALEAELLEKEQLLANFHIKCEEAITKTMESKAKAPLVIDEVEVDMVIAETADGDYETKVAIEEITIDDETKQEIRMLQAQIIGLERIVEERDNVIEELVNALDKIVINRDVLLSRIGDQNDALRELHEDRRNMAKALTEKNKQIAYIEEQLEAATIR